MSEHPTFGDEPFSVDLMKTVRQALLSKHHKLDLLVEYNDKVSRVTPELLAARRAYSRLSEEQIASSILELLKTPLRSHVFHKEYGVSVMETVAGEIAREDFAKLPREEQVAAILRYQTVYSWWIATTVSGLDQK